MELPDEFLKKFVVKFTKEFLAKQLKIFLGESPEEFLPDLGVPAVCVVIYYVVELLAEFIVTFPYE